MPRKLHKDDKCDCGNPAVRIHGSAKICRRCYELEVGRRLMEKQTVRRPVLMGECCSTVHQISDSYDAWLERRGLEKSERLNFGSLK